jgi:hypothetical protein
MRNYIKGILVVALTTIAFSCADEALDPLQFEKVKKGTLLVLRGSQLDALYFDGADYGDSFFANDIQAGEAFEYEAEFLSADPNSLESVDIFVYKNVLLKNKKGDKDSVATSRLPQPLKNISASAFQKTDKYLGPWTSVSIPLTSILAAVGEPLDTPEKLAIFFKAYKGGIKMESDLNLKDGSKVLAADLVAGGLVESDQFFPAQKLTYGVEDIEDARPIATLSQRGQVGPIVSGKVTRPIIPLRSGVKDTLNIVFDQTINTPPTVSVIPASAGTIGAVVPVKDKNGDILQFYVPFVAGTSYTGNARFSITGATSAEPGAQLGLEQSEETEGISGIAVDNLAPQNTSFTTGTRLGKGQSATITLRFNEAIGTVPTVTITPGTTGVDGVTNVKTVLSADKLTATYTYEYKDLDNNATHGDATVAISGGTDVAGNALGVIGSKPLTIDIGAAPAPSIALDVTFDWGTQIKWTIAYATGASNPNGSTSGTVYYVALTAGDPAPTGFVGGDVPQFTMAEDPTSTETPKEKVTPKQTGTVALAMGTTGSVFSAFTPNGTLDVYAVVITSSGVISAITPVPTTVTMN